MFKHGYFVDCDTHGDGRFEECAWFAHEGDADDFIAINEDEPTIYRKRPAAAAVLIVDNTPLACAVH